MDFLFTSLGSAFLMSKASSWGGGRGGGRGERGERGGRGRGGECVLEKWVLMW